jgi:hypothetical protein
MGLSERTMSITVLIMAYITCLFLKLILFTSKQNFHKTNLDTGSQVNESYN